MYTCSLFSGVGGLDLGFKKAGFSTNWANENNTTAAHNYRINFPETKIHVDSIENVDTKEIPDCDGIIGGPPCQSWSIAGAKRGIKDKRGKLIINYINIVNKKKPKFILIENVHGLIFKNNKKAFFYIKKLLEESGYKLHIKLLNASDFSVPQDRKRVFIIGIRKDINKKFIFPNEHQYKYTLKEAIFDLRDKALPSILQNKSNKEKCLIPNHEYMTGGFSYIYMSRNRRRDWDQVSYTIQASGRHAPIHPDSSKMLKVKKDKMEFDKTKIKKVRRLSVRECARIQTFPDDFKLEYNSINDGYKMIGNAVPVELSRAIANQIKEVIF